jgi:SAM-dependent methyltransferase
MEPHATPTPPAPPIRFDDGAAYEEFMGVWSRLAGEDFLRWLAPAANARWADVGCGNGAFTALLLDRCAAAEVHGIDPSEEQIAYARTRLAGRPVQLRRGDAMALPWGDAAFDAAVMALVIFFVPDPAKGVAEMARVVGPGGSVSAYAWDILGGGFPYAVLQEEMAAIDAPPAWPPSVEASRIETMRSLWQAAGLVDVETDVITVERTFADFESYWAIARTGPRLAASIDGMDAGKRELFRARLRARLPADAAGRIPCSARANAIRGRVAKAR